MKFRLNVQEPREEQSILDEVKMTLLWTLTRVQTLFSKKPQRCTILPLLSQKVLMYFFLIYVTH